MRRTILAIAAPIALAAAQAQAEAQESKSVSPYIDEIRQELPTQETTPQESYTQKLQRELKEREAAQGKGQGSYTEQLKQELGGGERAQPAGSYTEQEKERLGPAQNGGAIQAVLEGKSELKPKMKGNIHYAAGLRYGAVITRDISASAATQQRPFNNVYGSNYAPDLNFYFEYQPWHSNWYGSIALFGQLGVGYYHGVGTFEYDLPKPPSQGTGYFGTESRTQFQFFTVPATAGLSYRFNLLRILRPFVMAGPTAITYFESRNDGGEGNRGASGGIFVSGGVSLLLDWLSRGSSWDLYADYTIKHYYLTVDYSRLSTFSGDVQFTVSGMYAGLAFEF